jgi:hypothetical protein
LLPDGGSARARCQLGGSTACNFAGQSERAVDVHRARKTFGLAPVCPTLGTEMTIKEMCSAVGLAAHISANAVVAGSHGRRSWRPGCAVLGTIT